MNIKKAAYAILLVMVIGGAFFLGAWSTRRAASTNTAVAARKILYYVDPMHRAYKSDKLGIAPDCGMELVPVYDDGGMGGSGGNASSMPPGTVNVTAERQQLIGVRIAQVEKSVATHTLRALGRVTVDDTRFFRLIAPTDGWTKEIFPHSTGSLVKKDEPLVSFYNRELSRAQQGYFQVLNAFERLKQSNASAEQLTLTADQVQATEETLRTMGMGDLQIQEIARTRKITRDVVLRAPVTGFVLARNVFLGQRFEPGTELFRLVDSSRVWILADVFENEAQYIRPGSSTRISLPSQRRAFSAKVSNLLPQFDAATRGLKVRLETDNPDYVLRPDMFVDVEFPVRLPAAIAVSSDAVLDSGIKKTVFVDRGEGIFEPREVETGWRHGDRVEILKGLMPGERIVVSGTFQLDSESRMKAAAAGATGHMHEGHAHAVEAAGKGGMTPVAHAFALAKDPICGMDVNIEKATAAGLTVEYQGKGYYFCTDDCKQKFTKDPEHNLMPPAKPDGHHESHQHGGQQL